MIAKPVYILGAKRTAIGGFLGAFSAISAVDLAVAAAQSVFEATSIHPNDVDEVVIGNVLSAGLGQNVARQIGLKLGVPSASPASTVNMVCGSGMKAIQQAYHAIALGEADLVLAGGTENMSQAPYLVGGLRSGVKFGNQKLIDSAVHDGLWCAIHDYHMGITAENIAEKYGISREAQDQFALESQQKAARAASLGVTSSEIAPVTIRRGKVTEPFATDEHIRPDTSVEKLATLKSAFKTPGTVTAGNASGINDGAACLFLASEAYVNRTSRTPVAVINGISAVGVDPSVMGIGPVAAVNKLREKLGIRLDDVDLFEFNEAFAVQALAVIQELQVDPSKVNVYGGAIAMGHPIGASGARIVVTLLNALAQNAYSHGIASLCIGGGQGIAIDIRRLAVA